MKGYRCALARLAKHVHKKATWHHRSVKKFDARRSGDPRSAARRATVRGQSYVLAARRAGPDHGHRSRRGRRIQRRPQSLRPLEVRHPVGELRRTGYAGIGAAAAHRVDEVVVGEQATARQRTPGARPSRSGSRCRPPAGRSRPGPHRSPRPRRRSRSRAGAGGSARRTPDRGLTSVTDTPSRRARLLAAVTPPYPPPRRPPRRSRSSCLLVLWTRHGDTSRRPGITTRG